jgi:hypothetical protein
LSSTSERVRGLFYPAMHFLSTVHATHIFQMRRVSQWNVCFNIDASLPWVHTHHGHQLKHIRFQLPSPIHYTVAPSLLIISTSAQNYVSAIFTFSSQRTYGPDHSIAPSICHAVQIAPGYPDNESQRLHPDPRGTRLAHRQSFAQCELFSLDATCAVPSAEVAVET